MADLYTLPDFMDLGRMPTAGEPVRVTGLLLNTSAMFVAKRFLDARELGASGVACGYVPGHGGDLWWVRHDDGTESCYMLTELTPRELVPKSWEDDENEWEPEAWQVETARPQPERTDE